MKKKPYFQKSVQQGTLNFLWRELLKYLRRAIDPNTMDTRFVCVQELIFDSVRKPRDGSFEEQRWEPEEL